MAGKEIINVDALIEKVYDLKGSNTNVAAFFNVSVNTILNYKRRYPNVAEAFKQAQHESDVELIELAVDKLRSLLEAENWAAVRFVLERKADWLLKSESTINLNAKDSIKTWADMVRSTQNEAGENGDDTDNESD